MKTTEHNTVIRGMNACRFAQRGRIALSRDVVFLMILVVVGALIFGYQHHAREEALALRARQKQAYAADIAANQAQVEALLTTPLQKMVFENYLTCVARVDTAKRSSAMLSSSSGFFDLAVICGANAEAKLRESNPRDVSMFRAARDLHAVLAKATQDKYFDFLSTP